MDWTPMTEKKPEKDGWYWTTDINGEVRLLSYMQNGKNFLDEYEKECYPFKDITAWNMVEEPAPYEPPMTEAEALKELGDPIVAYNPRSGLGRALKLARKALKKRIPKRITDSYEYSYYCPECEKEVVYEAAYCHFCGQALEWED